MNAYARSQMAYSQSKAATRSEQSIEYELFAQTTSGLSQYADDRTSDYQGFIQALHQNRRLWLTIASDVAEDGNLLPKELRAQIFYLAEFTRLHTSKVISENASVSPLIEINRSIMKGLFAQGGAS